ncbi:MAG: hypothetical protein HY744_31355 [Deltaproteobacteria bacterium]|nr:hypothetical protein [Deltaproteobacteria bacterium]
MADKYGIALEQLSPVGLRAVKAAQREQARTVIFRDSTPVAAIISLADLERIEPADPGAAGTDSLLLLCGTAREDAFADELCGREESDLTKTQLFGAVPTARGAAPRAGAAAAARPAAPARSSHAPPGEPPRRRSVPPPVPRRQSGPPPISGRVTATPPPPRMTATPPPPPRHRPRRSRPG